jgi:hypothetical protein
VAVTFEYFSASSDDEAASVIDRFGGPGSRATATPAPVSKHSFFRRTRLGVDVGPSGPSLPGYDAVPATDIDPVVQLGTLEELLTGRPFDDILADPLTGRDIAVRDGGERLVVTINQAVSKALAAASDESLAAVAIPWARAEEFGGRVDPTNLAAFLRQLAGLARRSEAAGQQLYCWVCV